MFRDRFRRPIESGRDETRLGMLEAARRSSCAEHARACSPSCRRARRSPSTLIWPPPSGRSTALRKACEQQLAATDKKSQTQAQFKIALLAALTRLRQLACDPSLVDDTFVGPSTKITRVVELTTQIVEEGGRVIVFSQFTKFLDKIRDALEASEAARRVSRRRDADREAPRDRRGLPERRIRRVLRVAARGRNGLNLTAASYVIHTDPWWNPAVEEQATSRAHRMGQTVPVTVHRLVSRGTIEEAVLAMHASKRALATSVVLDGHGEVKTVTPAELDEAVVVRG